VGLASPWPLVAVLVLALGAGLLATTAVKCGLYALRSDVDRLPPLSGLTPRASLRRYRGMIAWLHFIQPLARLRGFVRGIMNPPTSVVPEPGPSLPARRGSPSPRETLAALRLLLGETLSGRFWSESWTGVETVLGGILKELRSSRAVRSIGVDDGWQHDRDLSVGLGPWARLDLRALVEEHAEGRVLVRVARRLRLSGLGAAALGTLAALLGAAALTRAGVRWPLASLAGVGLVSAAALDAFARLLRASVALERAVSRTAAVHAMKSLDEPAGVLGRWPQRLAWGFRGTIATALLGVASSSLSSIVQGALPSVHRAPETPTAVASSPARIPITARSIAASSTEVRRNEPLRHRAVVPENRPAARVVPPGPSRPPRS
jgi:hypothetical protein